MDGQCSHHQSFAAVTTIINIQQTIIINQPSGYPTLPASAPVTVQSVQAAPGSGGNLASQNVAGGGLVTQQGEDPLGARNDSSTARPIVMGFF